MSLVIEFYQAKRNIVTKKNKQKSKSVEERIPKVKNFQWWANYEMAS